MTEQSWEEKLQVEAMQMSSAIHANWRHGLNQGLTHLPDATKPEYRSKQLDIFADALVGIAVNCLLTYGNTTKEFEDLIVESVRYKCQYIRENEIELRKKQADQASKLVGLDGEKVSSGH